MRLSKLLAGAACAATGLAATAALAETGPILPTGQRLTPRAAHGAVFQMLNPDLPGLLAQGYVRYWDTVAGVPYLYSAQRRVFVTYEDPQSIARKCRYVRERNLGGVMFWEYFNDTTGILLDAVHAGLSPTLSSAREATDHGNSPAAN